MRGGKRLGAGRKHGTTKKGNKQQIGTRLSQKVLKFLRNHDRPISQLIEEAVIGWFKIDGK